MKLRIRDRVALAIYSLIGLCASLVLGAAGYYILTGRLEPAVNIGRYTFSIFMLVAALVLLVYSICMLRLAFRRKAARDRHSVTVQNTQQGNGEVRVSVQALDSLVKQAIMGHMEGVADIKTNIVNHEDSISVKIEMSLNGDVHIPNMTMLLQSTIKNFIEEFSGIAVREVSIMVNTIIPVTPQLVICNQNAPESVVLEEGEHHETQIDVQTPEVSEQEEEHCEETPEEEIVPSEETAVQEEPLPEQTGDAVQ